MTSLIRWLKLWKGWSSLELASSMEYRFDFMLRVIAMAIFGVTGPIAGLLIYSVSAGIPGWTIEQFMLLTGTFTLVLGIDSFLFVAICWKIVDNIWQGTFDFVLVKPANPLGFATATAIDYEGLPRVIVGCVVVTWALVKMGWAFNAPNMAVYLLLLGLALLFKYSINVIATSLAFLIVKSQTLLNIFDNILDVGRNPLTVYGSTGMLLFTFLFPLGIMSFYPAQALLGQVSLTVVAELAVIVLAFFGISMLAWRAALDKYASAGG